jgi:hypothetical protein
VVILPALCCPSAAVEPGWLLDSIFGFSQGAERFAAGIGTPNASSGFRRTWTSGQLERIGLSRKHNDSLHIFFLSSSYLVRGRAVARTASVFLLLCRYAPCRISLVTSPVHAV